VIYEEHSKQKVIFLRGTNSLITNSQICVFCVRKRDVRRIAFKGPAVVKRWILIMGLIYFFMNVMSETPFTEFFEESDT